MSEHRDTKARIVIVSSPREFRLIRKVLAAYAIQYIALIPTEKICPAHVLLSKEALGETLPYWKQQLQKKVRKQRWCSYSRALPKQKCSYRKTGVRGK